MLCEYQRNMALITQSQKWLIAIQIAGPWNFASHFKPISELFQDRFHKLVCALRQTVCTLRPTFEKLFTALKVQRKVQILV